MGKHPVANQPRDAAQKNSGSDEKRRALRGEAARDRCPGAAHEQILQREFMVSRYPLQEQHGRKSTTTVERCAVPRIDSSSTDFSLWVLVLARPHPHRLKSVPLAPAPLGRPAPGSRAWTASAAP